MTKLLPSPPTIEVTLNEAGEPLRLRWGRWQVTIDMVCNHWRVEDDWWRAEVARDYYKVRTADGVLCVIFLDRQKGTWHLQRVFD